MPSLSDISNRAELVRLIERYIATQVRSQSEKNLARKLFLGDTCINGSITAAIVPRQLRNQ